MVMLRSLSHTVSPPDYIRLVIPPLPYHGHHKNLHCVCGTVHVHVYSMCCYVCKQACAFVYMDIIVCIYLTVFLQELAPAAITFDGYLLWLGRAERFPVGDSWGF